MGFSVDTAALAGLPRLLERAGDDAHASRVYVEKHTVLGEGEGVFNIVLGGHRTATARVTAFFNDLDHAVGGHSSRLQSAVNLYKRSDLAAAAALDATAPAVQGTPWSSPETLRGGFADRYDPQDLLTAPRDYSAEHPPHVKWYGMLSPSSHVRKLVWEATELGTRLGFCDRPVDIFTEYLKPLLGDWRGFRACADVFEQGGRAAAAIGNNLYGGAADSQEAWTGNAADACRQELAETQLVLIQATARMQHLAAEYRSAADSTEKVTDAIAGLTVVAADLAVMAAIEAAAAVETSPTVIGAIGFGAMAVATLAKLMEVLMKIGDCVKIAFSLADLFTGSVQGISVIDPGKPFPGLDAVGATPPSHSDKKPV